MQVGSVSFARVERYPDALCFRVGFYSLHAFDAQERFSQVVHAFSAIIPFSRDVDCLKHGMVSGVMQIMWISWVHAGTSRLPRYPGAY